MCMDSDCIMEGHYRDKVAQDALVVDSGCNHLHDVLKTTINIYNRYKHLCKRQTFTTSARHSPLSAGAEASKLATVFSVKTQNSQKVCSLSLPSVDANYHDSPVPFVKHWLHVIKKLLVVCPLYCLCIFFSLCCFITLLLTRTYGLWF